MVGACRNNIFYFYGCNCGLLWGLAIKASYNEEKMKQKQNQKENQDGK